jgi:hypothetical protein
MLEALGESIEKIGPPGNGRLNWKQRILATLLGGRSHLFYTQISLIGIRR